MGALVAALLVAGMPVRPIADAPRLVGELGHGKPLVLHFFASWCGACREEFPRLRETLLGLPGRGVEIALVTIDRPEDREQAEEMLREFRLDKLPSLLLDAPAPDPVAQAMGRPDWDGALPATFVFDARGKLVQAFIGVAELAPLRTAIAKAAH
jgi:thiol-disulfide isomerase/thioredoxin